MKEETKEKYICRNGDFTETDLNNVLKVMFLNNYKPVCMSSSRFLHLVYIKIKPNVR